LLTEYAANDRRIDSEMIAPRLRLGNVSRDEIGNQPEIKRPVRGNAEDDPIFQEGPFKRASHRWFCPAAKNRHDVLPGTSPQRSGDGCLAMMPPQPPCGARRVAGILNVSR
jgi:hypothetical protein